MTTPGYNNANMTGDPSAKLSKLFRIDLKWKWSLIITALVIGLFNPFMYSLTDFILLNGGVTYDKRENDGTVFGKMLHLVVFVGLLRIMFAYN